MNLVEEQGTRRDGLGCDEHRDFIEASRWARSLGFKRRCMMGRDLLAGLSGRFENQDEAREEVLAAGAMAILDKIRRSVPQTDEAVGEFGLMVTRRMEETPIAITVSVDASDGEGLMIVRKARV